MNTNKVAIERLQTLHDELTDRIEALDADIHHKTIPVEKDSEEQVTQRENDDVLMTLEQEARATLSQVDSALDRIANGSYGICIKCQEKIPKARLDILPYVSTCIDCSE